MKKYSFLLLLCSNLAFPQQYKNNNNYVVLHPGDTGLVRKAATVTPSARQLRWQQLELTAFFHFGVNTFTDREWGTGKEDPQVFNPASLDARQWVRVCKEAGIKQVILTAKHHDGFCLWPSRYTEHSVKNSPWKNGKGDVVKEVSDACHEYGIGFGIYLSPWDRNSSLYGTDAYNDYFVNQLTELLTQYGRIDEVWFDGANGEGPNGKKQVYDFDRWYRHIRNLQPTATIAIMGPDVRWVGTESGYGRETEWSVVPADNLDQGSVAGNSQHDIVFKPQGDMRGDDLGGRDKIQHAKGLIWYPAETDVSIRPGWFYHDKEDEQVKSPEKLLDIYYSSVGRNSVLLLNIPPDKRGLIHENDVKALQEWKRLRDQTFGINIARNAIVNTANGVHTKAMFDDNNATYWTTKGQDTAAVIDLHFSGKQTFDVLQLQENIRLGQRIEKFELEYLDGKEWKKATAGTTVGYKRLIRFPAVTTDHVRLNIISSRLNPTIAEMGLYKETLDAPQAVSIIPQPVSIQLKAGSFLIDGNTTIQFSNKDRELQAAAGFLSGSIKSISRYTLPVNKAGGRPIQLALSNVKGIGEEGYELQVSASAISIKAHTKTGIVYGIQSLLQTLPQIRTNVSLKVPCIEVTDYPRFKWRGMLLDVSRHFFSPGMIKEYIDLMASYKMNVFHWHLCDDHGWRLEIKKYPELTSVGAWRVERPGKSWRDREPAKEGEPADYGGYYTQEQVKEIVAYAQARNITIIPEIEMPGHAAAAIAAYPALSCTQQPQFVVTGGQYPKGVQSNYCPGNDSSFIFLQDVLKEVMQLFPSEYIHVGGDEVDKTGWKNCLKCQARMKAEGLKDENELQSYVIRSMEKYLVTHHRKLIGWDEILEGGLAPEATVMSWRGESGGIQAAKMKHDVVMTPGSPCYFDHYQAGPEGEPLAIGGFNTLKKVYSYEPVPQELTQEEAKYVLGAQGNVWTEFIPTAEHLEYMVLPRMPALAEVLWTPKENRNWLNFNRRLQYHFKGYEQKGFHYSPGNFTVDIKPASINGRLLVNLSSEIPDGTIYYTLDGSLPGTQSRKYEQAIPIDSSVTVKAVTALNGRVMGVTPAAQSFVMHKAIGRDVVYTNAVNGSYMADGPNSLTDGIRGTTAVGKYWHGFYAKDLQATIDLGEEKNIHSLTLGCLQNYRDWIFLPQSVTFEVSADGKSFNALLMLNNPVSVNEKNAIIHNFTAAFAEQKTRYIRVTAKNLGVCPKGHNGEGQPAWLFADELVVE